MRVLLVEDDNALATVIAAGLQEEGVQVVTSPTFRSGNAQARAGGFDVVVLDVMLPGGTGFDLCKQLRSDGVKTPVLMLTARDSVDDRVAGFESGADDYLTKPFAFRELLARVRALTRRRWDREPDVVKVADLEVDIGRRRVRRNDLDIELTAKEFALLACFIEHRDRVIDRALITSHVWDENHDPFTNVLEVLVRRLRRKIDDGHGIKLIHTYRGAGYRFGT